MLRVGLTGGIGSGKSTVATLLRAVGAQVTDGDVVAREIVEPGQPSLAAIGREFGAAVITPDGHLDRAGLAAIVFPDPARLRALEAITGPAIAARVAQLRSGGSPGGVDVYDMPLLVEKGLWVHEHLSIVVAVDEEIRVRRLVDFRGMPEADARARIATQASDTQRRLAADVWLPNEGSREDLATAVERLWHGRLQPYAANLRDGIRVRRERPARVVDPDPDWPAAGARVVARIAHALAGHGVVVDHIGSTSVPGLAAKDVIDVQVGVRHLSEADSPVFRSALRSAGYLCQESNTEDTGHPGGQAPWPKRFYGGCDPGRVVHLHVREIGSPGYLFALAFRDWLRAEPAARTAYEALKRKLAALERDGALDYTAAKEPWFGQAYPEVAEWVAAHTWSAHQVR